MLFIYIFIFFDIIKFMKKEIIYEKISGVHLELTTKCNAMCPMCNRNFKGNVRKKLEIKELTLSDIKKIFPKTFVKQLSLISMCGVYGEPICNLDIKNILKYFYECNPNLEIDIYTNGGLYDTNWWEDLARIMNGKKGNVIFGIDGLGETHSLHRCNVDFDKVISNAKSFIVAGGKAQWDFLVFKHNENQVEEARKYSERLGFNSFQVKKSSRFLKTLYEKDENLDSTILEYGKHPVYNKNGQIDYYIELPKNKAYRNDSEKLFFDIKNKYDNFEKYLDKIEIDCEAIKNQSIFVSASGEIFPCCTVYQQICYKTIHEVSDKNELNEYFLYADNDLNSLNKSIETIVNGKFFKELFNSFNCKRLSEGKPKSCSRTCGKKMDLHKNSHTTKIKYRRD